MKVEVPYAKGKTSFETDVPVQIVDSAGCDICDADEIMSEALENPIGQAESFGDFARDSKKLLFILCDGTRPTPTALTLKHIYEHIKDHPDVGFIIATGSHRAPTEEEYRRIFGQYLDEFRSRITVHDARNNDLLEYLGETSRKSPVRFNRKVMEADGLVTINSVEPHYFRLHRWEKVLPARSCWL